MKLICYIGAGNSLIVAARVQTDIEVLAYLRKNVDREYIILHGVTIFTEAK